MLHLRPRPGEDRRGADEGKPGAGQGGDQQGDKPGDKPKDAEQKQPALAQPGYGVDFGHEGGKRADLPPFPARIRPMSSMRGGVLQRGEGDERAGVPFIYQPVRGAAVYQMVIDYTSAAPGQLLFQAAAAGVLHAYRWELWDITESHDKALADAAEAAARTRPGQNSRTIDSTDAAHQRLGVATDELDQRPQQYDEDQRRAIAEWPLLRRAGQPGQQGALRPRGRLSLRQGAARAGAPTRWTSAASATCRSPPRASSSCAASRRYDPYAEREGGRSARPRSRRSSSRSSRATGSRATR